MLKYYRPNPAGLSDYLTSAIDTTEKYREQLQDMQNQLSKFRQLALKELAQNMTLSQKLAVLNQRNAA
jgi:DNA integrity scanning protein DisA with diadenylate cyclase activity